jgi:protein translocase SecG subunit
MKDLIIKAEILISILLVILILLQAKGSGLGSMGGVDDSANEQYSTKRGAEKILHTATVVLAVVFAGLAALYPFV